MTEEKIAKITRLAEAVHLAAERHKSLSTQSVQQNFEERKKQSVAYALAEAEMWEAKRFLELEVKST